MTGPSGLNPVVVAVGHNDTLIWGMTAAERLRRLSQKAGLTMGAEADAGPKLLVNLAYAFDPQLLRHLASQPASALIDEAGIAVIVHLDEKASVPLPEIARSMESGVPIPKGLELQEIRYGPGFTLYNHQLRKREQPFLMRLTPESRPAIERASYYAAYKGVTDLLTKYLWPELAFHLTRLAARIGASPNMVTTLGAILCVLAGYYFWHGQYWQGVAAGFGFMVLDTVDGKLARCTITSSKWGNVFDHGIDQVHPPFWWWAWAVGLGTWGLAFSPQMFALVIAAIVGGYVVQRVVEGVFVRAFGLQIHVWEQVDSRFRLITARRNPNMLILVTALLMKRPDVGLLLVAAWTVLSCCFHIVRLSQALTHRRRGSNIRSWIT